jgi:hypothetical protein
VSQVLERRHTVLAPRVRRRGLTLTSLWVFVALFLPVVASLQAQLSTVDLAYHIRAGEEMLSTRSLLRTDTFTFTGSGREWLNQQWGAQVIFARLFRWGGWEGLAILRAFLVAGIFLFAFLAARAAGAPRKRAAWSAIGTFLLTVGGLSLRPQLFAMVLFSATVWIVTARDRAPGRLWAIPPMVALWANLHGSFFLPLILLALAWLEERRGPRSERSARLLAVIGASLVATMVNPYGPRVWQYVYALSTNRVVTQAIQEWQPTSVRDVPGALFFVSVAAVAAILARRKGAAPWTSLLTLGVFFLIGLFAIRGVFWWAIVAPPVVARLLSAVENGQQPAGRQAPVADADRPGSTVLNRVIAGFLVLAAVAFLPWWRGRIPLSPSTPLLDEAPLGITRFLERTLRPGERIFNAQIWGSWFEFALPENPVFADSRIEVLPARIWDQYLDISRGQEGWQSLLDRWGVVAVVAHREQQAELIPIIKRAPGWRLAYADEDGYVFLRT